MADSSPLRVANGEESSGEEEEEDVAGLELDMEEEEAAALEAEARGEQFDVDEELEGARAPPIVISRSFSEISRSSHLAVRAGEESSGEEEEEDIAGLGLDMEEEEAAALEAEARGEQFDVDEEMGGARAPPIVISRSF